MINFKLIGLNKPWKAGGFSSIYATISTGKEYWFHASFDKEEFPDERLNALFDMFKNNDDNLWYDKNHRVDIHYKDNRPIIEKLTLDNLVEQKNKPHEYKPR